MTRVAVITGGTLGIGAEVSKGLHKAGYKVVANYHRNVDGAKRFHEETGIPVEAWNVADYDACEQSVARIAETWGQVDVMINTAGITRDTVLHRMAKAAWHDVIETNLTSCYTLYRPDDRKHVQEGTSGSVRVEPGV